MHDDEDPVRLVRVAETAHTRPFAYTLRVTDSLYKNFRVYFQALEGSMEMQRLGQGSQTLHRLTDIGRRLSSIDFIVFMLGLHDLSAKIMHPFAMLAQQEDVEAAQLVIKSEQLLQDLRNSAENLGSMRKRVFASCLVTTMLSLTDLRRFWAALAFSSWARPFPLLMRHMAEVLHSRRMQGCGLQCFRTADAVDRPNFRLLHPRCQCDTMTVPRGTPTTPRFACVRLLGRDEPVRVPEWSCRVWSASEKTASMQAAPGGIFPPRFRLVEKEYRPPLRLQGVPRFSGHNSGHGCSIDDCAFFDQVWAEVARRDKHSWGLGPGGRRPGPRAGPGPNGPRPGRARDGPG